MENVIHHGRLYGLGGRELRTRADEMLARLGLADRRRELVEQLSGGLRRRVELATGMLHRPRNAAQRIRGFRLHVPRT